MPPPNAFNPLLRDMDDKDDLTSRVQDLPPELFSRIYEFVTAVEPDLIVEIASTYRHPSILQLDRASREKISKQYYSRGTTFRFAKEDQDIILVWLRSVPTRSRSLIKRIEVGHEQHSGSAHRIVSVLAREAKYLGMELNSKVFWATFSHNIKRTENRPFSRVKYLWTAA